MLAYVDACFEAPCSSHAVDSVEAKVHFSAIAGFQFDVASSLVRHLAAIAGVVESVLGNQAVEERRPHGLRPLSSAMGSPCGDATRRSRLWQDKQIVLIDLDNLTLLVR